MAKQGFRVMDSDLHVIEPRNLWEDYIDPKFRGRIVTVPDTSGQMRAHVDGKVLPPYADRPERQRAWSLRMDRPGWDRIRRGTTAKDVAEAMDVEGIETKRKILWDNCARLYNLQPVSVESPGGN